ncbi:MULTISPECIES: FAD:protein FMN transferase [Bizionia]|uniref:FAD:protein FMN transferase n=1 Tax=Bizionia algoritergicola TaxID=291187 RepID=A0A5D0QR31_9FLAO|nr:MULTISPECIES: FAD:protein FMN transferase [Bizionia]OBX21252.1 thiamine biosynthesis protein ApbE [Bizionia sp. APA-3]TYB71670.1 FAD:protein FMN transferase [Bizionia algoritergicola]
MKVIVTAYCLFLLSTITFAQGTYKRTMKLMGSRFDITVVADSQIQADGFIDQAVGEIERIERLISSWDPNSQTSLINRNAGIKSVVVDKELYHLIERAIGISKLTQGAFDISYASMDKIWKFDGSMTKKPSDSEISESVAKVGYQNIILNKEDTSVFLKLAGMKIGFGAIGKGYAADSAKELLKRNGVKAGIINASGDMNTWGNQTTGEPWKIAITNPLNKDKVFAMLPVDNRAIVTSGNYEKFVKFNDVRYSHIIDPRTGFPSIGIISVSVLAPKAELADALATSIYVMGKDVGLNFVNQLETIDCIIINESGEIFYSDKIQPKQ